jgi:hypothetical protein
MIEVTALLIVCHLLLMPSRLPLFRSGAIGSGSHRQRPGLQGCLLGLDPPLLLPFLCYHWNK